MVSLTRLCFLESHLLLVDFSHKPAVLKRYRLAVAAGKDAVDSCRRILDATLVGDGGRNR